MSARQKRVVALGSFDGLHRGHLRVLESACREAKNRGATAAVLLFDVHPQSLVGMNAPPALQTHRDRDEMLRAMGMEIITLPFSALRAMPCESFVREVLYERLSADAVCCGFNYRFGAGAAGNAQSLKALCSEYGISVLVTDEEDYAGQPVSSTRIRTALLDGRAQDAAEMLGRPFSYSLTVVHGDARGRTIGFPTVNQRFPQGMLVPKYGVYASCVEFDGSSYPGVTNVGVRPTVGGGILLSESCILGFSGDLYDKSVRVSLLEYLRNEITFDGFDGLRKQISDDAQRARTIFEKLYKQDR